MKLLKTKISHDTNLLSQVVSTENLDNAFKAVYPRRQKNGPNSCIWSLSLRWPEVRDEMRIRLLAGNYELSPVSVYRSDQGYLSCWGSYDAVILKALSLVLAPLVSDSVGTRCYHLRGHGGIKGAMTKLRSNTAQYQYAIKSDVHQFYDSMNHKLVLTHCKTLIKDKRIIHLIAQYLNRCEVLDGDHRLIEYGIPKGCPLSPLMGALMLKSLDACVPDNAFYARYMDDWVILVKTRAQCRRLVKKMHQVMHRLKFKLALDKTFIGPIKKGFDFLGYRFNHRGLIGLAKKTIRNFIERVAELYEQGASDERIRLYVGRWAIWCRSCC